MCYCFPKARILTSSEMNQVISVNLETPDTVEKVCRFYEKELGVTRDAFGTIMAEQNGRIYSVSATKTGTSTTIAIVGKQ